MLLKLVSESIIKNKPYIIDDEFSNLLFIDFVRIHLSFALQVKLLNRIFELRVLKNAKILSQILRKPHITLYKSY